MGSIARGGSTYTLDSMFQGAMKAYGQGARIEFAQEMTTEFLTIMSDAAIKGEYIDPVEAFGRVVRGWIHWGYFRRWHGLYFDHDPKR